MKSILKKNQIVLFAIALMLIVAGYMNYTSNDKQVLQTVALTDTEKYAQIGDATLVSANAIEEKQEMNENSNIQSNYDEEKLENTIDTVSSIEQEKTMDNQYFVESRLEREKMYSQMIESYQNILNNSQISDTQKQISQNEIKNINETRNAITISENLIKNKGFEDLIIFVNGDSINIIVKAKELTEEQIAKIQNIVTRELKAEIENIHISNKEM